MPSLTLKSGFFIIIYLTKKVNLIMIYNNLQQFIKFLEEAGELRRVSVEVDPVLEITEIADRMSKTNGPALLFENVRGYSFPLLINAFGSYRRMEYALNCNSLEEISEKLEANINIQPPKTLTEKIKMLFTLKQVADILPKKVRHAPCQ